MTYITETAGYWFLGLFGIAMLIATVVFGKLRGKDNKEGFLVANRKIGWFVGGSSIAARRKT